MNCSVSSLSATQSNSDDIVDDIKSHIEQLEKDENFIYHFSEFDNVFSDYRINHNKIKKTKLIEAGLIQTGEIAIPNAQRKRAKYWVRSDSEIYRNKNGTNCINGIPLSKCLQERCVYG
jgi:hypothetical protein